MTAESHLTNCRTAPGDVDEKGQTQNTPLTTNAISYLLTVALGHLKERDGRGLLLEQVRVCVSPAQGQSESPPLTVEGKLKLLLFRAGRRGRMVGACKVKDKPKEVYSKFYN